MHRRHQQINIPTEVVRTLVAIADAGSFSKAGERLNLSQPAISAQVKRLQLLIGGAIFHKSAGGGLDFTPRGRMVLSHARRLLEANDQILSLGGAAPDHRPIRLGITSVYVERFLSMWLAAGGERRFLFHCGRSDDISKALIEGFVDVACLLHNPQQVDELAVSWQEDIVWARRSDFVLSPGAPIPLVSWPGNSAELPAINALEQAGISYRIVFTSADLRARQAAVAAGIGLMTMPAWLVAPPLVIANDYYLPKLRPLRAGVAIRRGFDAADAKDIIAWFTKLGPEGTVQTAAAQPKSARAAAVDADVMGHQS
ncbi:MAG: LysR family transcriptional regulator [Proteobacteria bacterium]|nr:LysR family transcriptional regulator [Pseudomonadota bacterium]